MYYEFMKRVFIEVIIIFVALLGANVFADTPELLIVEIQTASKASASEEIVRIANSTNNSIDLTGKRLEYFSANPKSISVPSRTINLLGVIAPKQSFLLTSKGYKTTESQQEFSSTLAAAGGHLRLSSGVVTNPLIYDFVGWGTALHARVSPSVAPKAGEQLMRQKDENGEYIFTGNNSVDFMIGGQNQTPSIITTTNSIDYSTLQITEILPNPASPQTDADDEYIELYNSGSESIAVIGLVLKTGKELSYSFKLQGTVIEPKQYLALYSKDTKLVLSNSGGKAELQTGEGMTLSSTELYSATQDGESYSFDGTNWRWTKVQTPNQENVFEEPVTTKSTTKKVATKKPKASTKKSKVGQVKSASTTSPKQVEEQKTRPVKSSVIAGVGTIGLIYGLYEYREDFKNFIYKIRKRRED